MNDLTLLITQVKMGNTDAYEGIVRRFQDMVIGFACARLGDRQLAEDVAQEAFINAYLALPDLRDSNAFPGWFRRIVIKQIDRVQRQRRPTVALETIAHNTCSAASPLAALEQKEVNDAVAAAIAALSEAQREVVTLYYMSEYSQNEISAFLSIPISTVKMRLYHARKLLKQQLLEQIEDTLANQRPSLSNTFMEKMMSIQVQTKTVPVQKLISMTRNTYIRDLQAHLDGSIQSLIIYAQTVRAEITGLPFAIYHGTPRAEQSGLIEICLPVTGDIPATIEITVKTLPARQVAYTVATLQQSIYPGLLKIHAALEEWINSNGHQRAEPPREIFLNFNNSIFSATAALDDQCIEAMWPYQ